MKEVIEFKLTLYCCMSDYCGKSYSTKLNLKRHILSKHSSVSRFNCEVCQKSFASKQNLVEHSYLHSGEKPYSCQFCSKTFRYASTYSMHKSQHKRDNRLATSKLSKQRSGLNTRDFEGEQE